jgi:NADH dehydrogenase [ubiquinone] 1 alpha subcomplex assembly factor 3
MLPLRLPRLPLLLPLRPLRRGAASHNLSDGGPDAHRISGFTAGSFTLAPGAVHRGALVLAGRLPFGWRAPSLAAAGADPAALLAVVRAVRPRPEILVLGTGARTLRPPPALAAYCRALGVALECSDSRRACATYNFLADEGRHVAAALLPVGWSEPDPPAAK